MGCCCVTSTISKIVSAAGNRVLADRGGFFRREWGANCSLFSSLIDVRQLGLFAPAVSSEDAVAPLESHLLCSCYIPTRATAYAAMDQMRRAPDGFDLVRAVSAVWQPDVSQRARRMLSAEGEPVHFGFEHR
jgi:hypothetical protein